MQTGAGLRILFWTTKMADVSIVLGKDMIVQQENEVNRGVREVGLKNLRWLKPPGSVQGPGKEGMEQKKNVLLVKIVLNLSRRSTR